MQDLFPFPLNPDDFLPDKLTTNGERVRSKSEVFIANLLKRMGIRYEYEKPLRLGREYFVPDFYLPDHDLYLEYYGILHWRTYEEKTAHKIEVYAKHNIRCIHLFSSMMINLNRIIRYELNRLAGAEKGEPYRFRAELPVFINDLEEQSRFHKRGEFKWTPDMDKVLLANRHCPENLAILAGIVRKEIAYLCKRMSKIGGKKHREKIRQARERKDQEAIRERIRKAYQGAGPFFPRGAASGGGPEKGPV